MVKTICKKMLPIMLALMLIMSVMPLGFMASATTISTVLDGQITITDTKNSISESGGTVTVTAKGSLFSKTTNNVEITNETGAQKKLTFSYNVSKSNAFNIDSTVTATSGDYSVTLAAGGTVKITLTSNSGLSNTTATLTMSGFKLEDVASESDVTVNFDETLGSVTVDGTAIANGASQKVSLETGATFAATPADGMTFLGWVEAETGAVISTTASFTYKPTASIAIKAMFMDKNSTKPYFMLGGLSSKSASSGFLGMSKINYFAVPTATHYFDDFTAAVNASAASGVSKAVVLLNNATLPAGDYTIPAGVTLVIPFDAENTVYKTQAQGRAHASGENKKFPVNIYRNLTLASGVNLTVNGDICLPAKHLYAQGSQIGGGSPVDNIPMITMEENSTITVNNGGAVYAYGYITGKGTLTAKNGATIYENFQINDFRGGTQSTDMENGVFPVAQYFIQNIEVLMKLEYGAKEYSYTTIYMSKADFGSAVNFIGPSNSMFNLTSGYVTKFYDGSTDRLIVDLYGDLTVSPVTLDVGGNDINSKDYELPINNNLTLTAHSGSNITMGQDVAMLPSSELIIEDGARCTIGKGVSVYIYDVDEWGNYTGATDLPVNPVFYAPGRTCALRTGADLVDAKVQLDGYIDASQGYIYSTAGGANIISTGTGTAILNKGTQAVTYQLIQKTVTYVEIPLIPVVFKNADGSDFNTATDTYNYVDGKWTCTNHNYTTETSDPTCTDPGHTKEYCSACGNVKAETEIPSLGHSYTSEKTDATCTVDGKIVYTCTKCGDTYEEVIKATGHSYGDWFVETPAKPGVAGLKVRECACGDRITEVIPAVEVLKFKSNALAIYSSLAVQYKVDAKYFTEYGYTNPYVVFEFYGNEFIEENYTYDEKNGVYIFTLSPIAPYYMNDKITATLYAELNGEVYTAVKKYSIVQYCVSQLSKHAGDPAYDELSTLLVDLLNYGAAAQIYVNHSVNYLANDILTDEWLVYGTTESREYTSVKDYNYAVVDNALATFKAVSLTLQDTITTTFKFELAEGVAIDGITAKIEAIGRTWDVDSSAFVYDEATGRYAINFKKLNAAQMSEMIKVTLYKDGVAVSNTATYSVESYALGNVVANNEKLADLVDAMLKYGDSAKAFVTP